MKYNYYVYIENSSDKTSYLTILPIKQKEKLKKFKHKTTKFVKQDTSNKFNDKYFIWRRLFTSSPYNIICDELSYEYESLMFCQPKLI